MRKLQLNTSLLKIGFHFFLLALIAYSGHTIYKASQSMYWDFPNYYVSAKLVSEGQSVDQFYNNEWFEAEASSMGIEDTARFNPFPPITSLVMLPLAGLEPLMAKQVWVAINVLLLIGVIALFRKLFRFDWGLSAFLVLISGVSLGLNFLLGQFYLLLLFLLLLSYHFFNKNRFTISASILSVITALKYFPVIFLAGFINRKYFLIFGLISISLLGLQYFFFGHATFQTYWEVVFQHFNGSIDGQGQHPISFQSFDSLLANLFITDPYNNTPPLFNWPAGKTIGKALILLAIGTTSIYTIKKVGYLKNEAGRDFTLAIVGLAAFTVLPASAPYHFVVLLFPFGILLKRLLGQIKIVQSLFLIFLFVLASNASLLGIPTVRYDGIKLLLNYPRLWATLALFAYSIILILKFNAKTLKSNVVEKSYVHLWQPI